MPRPLKPLLLLAAALLAAPSSWPRPAQAVSNWASAGSGLYADPANWSPMNVPGDEPGLNESAWFSVVANLKVTLPDAATAGTLRPHSVRILAGSVTLLSPSGVVKSHLDVPSELHLANGAKLLVQEGVQLTGGDLHLTATVGDDTQLSLLEGASSSFKRVAVGASGIATRDALLDLLDGGSLSYELLLVGGGAGGQGALVYVDDGELTAAAGGATTISGGGRIFNNGGSVNFGAEVNFESGGERYREFIDSGAQRSFAAGSMITVGASGIVSFDAAGVELDAGQTLAIDPLGEVSAAGGVLLGGDSTLRLTLDPRVAAPPALSAVGEIALAGTLEVNLVPAPELEVEPGYSQTLVSTSGGVVGAFDQIALPRVEGVSWLLDSTDGVLSLTAHAAMPGDYNSDGLVDVADYTIWRDSVAAGSPVGSYQEWRDHFGNTLAASIAAPAPEPAGLTLALLAVFSGFSRRRR